MKKWLQIQIAEYIYKPTIHKCTIVHAQYADECALKLN